MVVSWSQKMMKNEQFLPLHTALVAGFLVSKSLTDPSSSATDSR